MVLKILRDVSSSSRVMMLFSWVCKVCKSSPSNSILSCFQPFLLGSLDSVLMLRASRKSTIWVYKMFHSSAWFGKKVNSGLSNGQCCFWTPLYCLLYVMGKGGVKTFFVIFL